MSERAYLALGSNVGDRVGTLQMAITMLQAVPEIEVVETSSFYESEPVGMRPEGGQPEWFVNAAVAIDTWLSPRDLLAVCLGIERQLGRERGEEDRAEGYASRTLDLDILFYGLSVIEEPGLVIPHPRMHERAFVLVPMLELAPDFTHPVLGKPLRRLYFELETPEEVMLFGTRHLMPRFQD